jgi:hypothetical protein
VDPSLGGACEHHYTVLAPPGVTVGFGDAGRGGGAPTYDDRVIVGGVHDLERLISEVTRRTSTKSAAKRRGSNPDPRCREHRWDDHAKEQSHSDSDVCSAGGPPSSDARIAV